MTTTKKAPKQNTASRLTARLDIDFPRQIARHVVEPRLLNGLYRHWRCGQPDSSDMYFSITTWPGFLAYTGDMGEYVFTGTEDMVAFFRGTRDIGYIAEKCVAHCREGVRQFSGERFEEVLAEELKDRIDSLRDNYDGQGAARKQALRNTFDSIDREGTKYDGPQAGVLAMKSLYESGLYDGGELPDCTIYTLRYLWCMRAIRWFIGQLDANPALDSAA